MKASKNLTEEVFAAELHLAILIMPVLFLLIAGLLILSPERWHNCAGWAISGYGFFHLIRRIGNWSTGILRITDTEILFQSGSYKPQLKTTSLSSVKAVKIRQSLAGKILGYGSVVLQESQGTISYDYIIDPAMVKLIIKRLITEQHK